MSEYAITISLYRPCVCVWGGRKGVNTNETSVHTQEHSLFNYKFRTHYNFINTTTNSTSKHVSVSDVSGPYFSFSSVQIILFGHACQLHNSRDYLPIVKAQSNRSQALKQDSVVWHEKLARRRGVVRYKPSFGLLQSILRRHFDIGGKCLCF